MSLYPLDSINGLAKVRAVLCGGGWTNRSAEAYPFVRQALDMVGGPWQVLILPTPTSEPCDEALLLRRRLKKYGGREMEVNPIGRTQAWPEPDEINAALNWANLVVIPGGNFPDYMELIDRARLLNTLRRKFLSGEAVFMGSSAGTVSWFDWTQTADIPKRSGGGVAGNYRIAWGIGAIPGFACAHYYERNEHSGLSRTPIFQAMMRAQPVGTVGFGIDTGAAIVLNDGTFQVATRDRYQGVQRLRVETRDCRVHLRLTEFRQGHGPVPLNKLYH